MFQRFITWIRGVFSKMFNISEAKNALKVDIAISQEMQTALDLWFNMYMSRAPWLNRDVKSLGLPAAIAGEFARLTCFEFESEVTGSARASYLAEEYEQVKNDLRVNVEDACAGGGMVFKPYVDGDHIAVDYVPAWQFFPTSFNSHKQVTGAVFAERVTKGKVYYTRMERHQRTDDGYIIQNLAFMSTTESSLGTQCSLSAVDEWADLEPEVTIRYKDGTGLDEMLFAYFKIPFANTVDPKCPLGVSVYSRAVGLIEEADRQFGRILWEYEGSELAIDASYGALKREDNKGNKINLPHLRQRLFRELNLDRGQSGDMYEVFNPDIRDESLFNGLDKLFKRIEFNCSLAYGTLSDPQNVDKTAEEIKNSKHRSFAAVSEIQKSLQTALDHLLRVMDLYTTMYNLAPRGEYEVSFTWGDGVLQDVDLEFTRRKSLADSGYLRGEKLVGWYFGVTDEDARKEYMPAPEPELDLEE